MIKYLERLANRANDTFITVTDQLITDMNSNPVTPVSDPPLMTHSYERDSTPPQLIGVRIDMAVDELFLTFNEPVKINTTVTTRVTLQSQEDLRTPGSSFFTLRGGSFEYERGTIDKRQVMITLTRSDVRLVKLDPALLVQGEDSTYISVDLGMIQDMAFNDLVPILRNESLRFDDVEYDDIRPVLLQYDIDLDEGTLTMTFDDVVDQLTFDATHITLQNDSDIGASTFYRLTGGHTETVDGYVTVLNFSFADLNSIKKNEGLATNSNVTYLSHTQFRISDERGLKVLQRKSSEAMKTTGFIEDTTDPVLEFYDLDMDRGELYLTYSETVKANRLVRANLKVQNRRNFTVSSKGLLSFTLTGTGKHTLEDSIHVNVTFSKADRDELKRLYGLTISKETTYLSLPFDSIFDMNSNPVVPHSSSDGQNVNVFTPDTTSPYLVFWDLDMNVGNLTILFDETVNASSFRVIDLILQNWDNSTKENRFRLRGGNTTAEDDTVIEVNVTFDDMNSIKQLESTATPLHDSYLSFNVTLVQDMNDNFVLPKLNGYAVRARQFVPDTTPPRLWFYDLDMDDGVMLLTFSETVNSSSVRYDYFTLQSSTSKNSSQQVFTLTRGTRSLINSRFLNISFSKEDLDEITRLQFLAQSKRSTYLSILEGGVKDMNSNLLDEIFNDTALNVKTFTEDTTSPIISSFDLDLDSGIIFLTFSETVNASSFDVTRLTVQGRSNSTLNGTHQRQLTDSSSSSRDSIFIQITLSDSDLNEIKRLQNLATEANNTFISSTAWLVRDMNKNLMTPIEADAAKKVSDFTEDSTRPLLENFDLDFTLSQLTLYFTETVRTSTLNSAAVTLRRSSNTTSSETSFTFSNNSFTASSDGTYLVVDIDDADLNEIKRLRDLATSNATTFISLTKETIEDMNGNEIVSISKTNAEQVQLYVPDSIVPKLLSFIYRYGRQSNDSEL